MAQEHSAATDVSAAAESSLSYDDLPYTAHPFPQTHPARLAAIARIRGLDAPAVETARVLEIGCASGGNLIPMAARLPAGRFLGLDLSSRQIAEGAERIRRLGLCNIELRQGDLSRFSAKEGHFDYIICHGVYSWVPQSVRDAILRICKENLAETGVAFVSYNVLPGWRLRQTMRDALALSIPRGDRLATKVAKARKLMALFAEHTLERSTWGRILRDEAALLEKLPDDYVGHEFLEDCNEPCSFTEFVVDAAKRDLMFISEAQLVALLPETSLPTAAETIRKLSGDKILEMQQNIDIFTGRTFRQSLLTHRGRDARIAREFSPASIEPLHLSPREDFKLRGEKDGRAVFGTEAGAHIDVADPACRRALEIFTARFPASSTVDLLIAELAAQGIPCDASARETLKRALFNLAFMGVVTPATSPTLASASIGDRPAACQFLRHDIAAGATISANLAHESISIDPIARIVVPLMTGAAEISDLSAAIFRAAQTGAVTFWVEGKPVEDPDDMMRCAKEHLARVLIDSRNKAMLSS